MLKPEIIIIGGPTASGKTDLSLKLARELNGEIISADSRQIYVGMDIGTAKVQARGFKEEFQKPLLVEGIPHYLIDILEPDEKYSMFQFKEQSYCLIQDILQRKKIPIVVGGTGLYLDAIMKNYHIDNGKSINENDKIRSELEAEYEVIKSEQGADAAKSIFFNRLVEIDTISAKKLGVGNIYGVIRALEFALSNNGKSRVQLAKVCDPPFSYRLIITQMARKTLYQRINQRIDQQIEEGLIEETQKLINQYSLNLPALSSLGYKQIAAYLNKEVTLDQALEEFKRKTRNFAKRQLTWFRRYNETAQFYCPFSESFSHLPVKD